MSIAFLAPSQDSEVAPAISSQFQVAPVREGMRCARVDSHQESASPIWDQKGTLPSIIPSNTNSPPDQTRINERASPSPSPSPVIDDAYTGTFQRQPRSPRPTYSEEQRFFVMYARLIQDKSWPDIEDDFATIFKQRSKGGLCSLYYRIRRSWGLEDVLKSDSNYWTLERRIVDERAFNFSRDFLLSIGYLQR